MRQRRGLSAVTVMAMLTFAAACNSAADEQPQMRRGGTLWAATSALPDNLDPQRISTAIEINVSRVISRTLTTFKTEPGAAGGELAADLATDLGRPRENNRIWSFQLRDGLKWADGSPITCEHLKYGAERNFASSATVLPYARNFLEDPPPQYKGPLDEPGAGLDSVKCLDARTVEYHLKFPVGDFNYAVALPIFAPVKPGADHDATRFNLEPMASGPYQVKPGSRSADEMTLVRNPHWSQTTDKVRKAYPDQIILQAVSDTAALTNSLIEDLGTFRNTVMLVNVAPNFLQQVVTDPKLLARSASGPSGFVRYFSINTIRNPHLKCRQALLFAFNKRKLRQAMGGSLVGDLATTMIPPTLRAYEPFDHYGTLANGGNGHPDRALNLIEEAKNLGITCPKKVVLAHPDMPTTTNRFVKTVIDAYLEIGVEIEFAPIPLKDYFTTIKTFEAQSKYDLIWASWIPDWSNGSAVIPPLFHSSAVADEPGEVGGPNYAFLRDPAIDKAIADAMLENNIERQWRMWAEIDSELQLKAVTIPLFYTKATRLHGSNVSGAFNHASHGLPDLASLGLLNPVAEVTGT